MAFPTHPLPADTIMARLAELRAHDVPWREGRLLAGIYDPGAETRTTIQAAYSAFLSENALYPNFFPSLLRIERDVVAAMAELLRGDGAVGNCTSGGTESILLAVKAARDHARATRPELTAPEIILPQTAHAAFHKACHYLGVRPVVTPIEPTSFRADLPAMAAAITPQTIMLVASAPCYSHGVIDPIPAIAALARERGLLCHVDACVGGIQLSVMRRMGYSLPDFDFSVPGVTSISVDLHKYGYAAKNCSAILYHTPDLRRHALFCSSATTGYAVINPTVLSTRSGGPLAGAWAAIHAIGETGYQQIVRETMACTAELIAAVRSVEGLRVLGAPEMCMFAFAAEDLNIFELDDAMARRGWLLQPQLSKGASPANLHVSVHQGTVGHADAFTTALRESVAEVRAGPGVGDVAALQAEVLELMARPGPETFARVAALAGLTPGQMPTGFARINTVLNLLPEAVVDALLVEYLNSIY
ncbi:MAG: aspartate aminotransferase family protein [Chloroflexi bacterium OHK40]